ncbi:MAG: preprotein translocase subunit YajC [Clostridia bacterium]|nr:preprotein translocase subunit YajC [Clostridia bacterium]
MNPEATASFGPMIMMVLMIVIFYFLLIRPQKKKEKQLRDMIAALKVGDEVASIGGIHGKITRIKDDIFVLETGVGTTKSFISIERSAISRLIKAGATVEAETEVEEVPEATEE